MAVYERSCRVAASLEDVWAFHSKPAGLVAVSPAWLGLRVERVADRRGETGIDELVEGAEIRLSLRPFGVGPRTTWTSRIVAREYEAERAFFRDRVVEGPVPTWVHEHRFVAVEGGTRIVDRVEYELPIDPAGSVSWVARPVLAAVFAHRHRRTRAELERNFPRR